MSPKKVETQRATMRVAGGHVQRGFRTNNTTRESGGHRALFGEFARASSLQFP